MSGCDPRAGGNCVVVERLVPRTQRRRRWPAKHEQTRLAATWLRPASEKKFELSELLIAFEDTEDLRSSINRLHPLVSVLSIAVLAVLCGADGPTSIRGCCLAAPRGTWLSTDHMRHFSWNGCAACHEQRGKIRLAAWIGTAPGRFSPEQLDVFFLYRH